MTEYNKMFSCPKCGSIGAIYVAKVAGNYIVIKQRCPIHGGRSFKIPLMEKDNFIHLIRDGVFRCYKCGQEAIVSFMKPSGPWALIKCSCPIHGRMPIQKIWSSIYTEISSMVVVPSQPTQPHPVKQYSTPSEEKGFCPNCGSQLEGTERYCRTCGSKID
jgi:transcription elongation factor Elf1